MHRLPVPVSCHGTESAPTFFLNDRFVASRSPPLKLSLLVDRHGRASVPAIPPDVSLAEETDGTAKPVV
ncbi:hypothetical protein VZT92_010618 [Zoarces viviparus]|uniref:Uncharacterized protein n=1 Tax=Zoarces viviparus TaxID=48416 RepID=A0AAW1F9I7_ZOAVI